MTALGRHSRRRKVGRDDYVHWEDTWYVVPWEWASATVQVETALRLGGDLRMHRILYQLWKLRHEGGSKCRLVRSCGLGQWRERELGSTKYGSTLFPCLYETGVAKAVLRWIRA